MTASTTAAKDSPETPTGLGYFLSRLPALRREPLGNVPTMEGLPVLGNLMDFRTDRTNFQMRAVAKGDLVRFRLGFMPGYVASAPHLAHEILVENADAFVKSAGLGVFARPLLGDGLLTSEHDKHKRMRRMMAPHFMPKRIAKYAEAMATYADRTARELRDGQQIDVGAEMMRLTLQIVGKTLFDADVGFESAEVGVALTEGMEFILGAVTSLFPLPPSWPTPRNRANKRAIARLDRIIYGLIAERRQNPSDRGDLLSMLLLAKDEETGETMSDVEVRDEAMTMFLAGHETTANALMWTLCLLAKHPAIREKLEQEVDATLGGRTATLEDLPKLPYTLAVFKEAMRLYPPAYVVGRTAIRDVTIGGHPMRPGNMVFVNIFGIHRSPRVHERPSEFDPARFLGEGEKAMQRFAYMPFGAGPRICIGNHFAVMEGHMILATLAQHLRLHAELPTMPEPEPLITLRPKGRVPMRVERRKNL